MALSSSLVFTAIMPSKCAHGNQPMSSASAFINPMKLSSEAKLVPPMKSKRQAIKVSASLKEKAVTSLTAVMLTAAMVIPDVAEAAQPGMSASLKNFLLSIAAGGIVLGVIAGAVIGVSYFDPVKRT